MTTRVYQKAAKPAYSNLTACIGLTVWLASSALVCAQSGPPPITGPLLGLVLDAGAQALRPIWGLPGGATIGNPLNLGVALAQAVTSPRQDYTLGVAADDGRVLLIRVGRGSYEVRALDGSVPQPDLIVLSTTGSAAALYSQASKRVRIFSGLPDAPAQVGDADVSTLSEPLRQLAVRDDGGAAIATFGPDGSVSTYVLAAGADARQVGVVQGVTAAAFLGGARDAVLADGAANVVFLLRDDGSLVPSRIAVDADGVRSPIAVQVSGDNRRAFVANGGSGSVLVLDMVKGGAAAIACRCTPTGMDRLSGDSVFRLTGVLQAPLWLLDADGTDPRFYFVPPVNGGAAQ